MVLRLRKLICLCPFRVHWQDDDAEAFEPAHGLCRNEEQAPPPQLRAQEGEMATARRALAIDTGSNLSHERGSIGTPFRNLENMCLPIRVCKKGTWIVTQGDTSESLYIVREGTVLLTRLSANGRETILGFAGPGEFFGDVPLLNDSIAHFNALAVQRTVLLVVRKPTFRLFLEDAAACKALIEVLAKRCDDAWAHIEALGSGPLADRVRVLLSWLGARIGVRTAAGIEIRMSQGQLAQMLGSSRESLNRQISTLREEGLLTVRRSRQTSLLLIAPDRLSPVG
jgi:CRP/FNR family transcriptional regulator, cyclic AMP receptor protein